MYDIVIIGAGIAGLSAAIYGKRAGKKVLVLEKNMYGGQIVVSPEVDNYPGIKHISGYELAMSLYEQADELKTEIKLEEVKSIELGVSDKSSEKCLLKYKTVVTDTAKYETKTVIIATGLEKRKLGLSDEDRLTGSGISYCATCDGAFYRGKTVAVNGGGNTALEDAIFLSEYCEKVYVIHRRDTFRGENNLTQHLISRDNVELVMNAEVISIKGDERLESIIVRNTKDDTKKEIVVQGLFIAIGQIPHNNLYKDLVKTDEAGYIVAGEDCLTSVEGIFAAGDCRTKGIRQLVTAASDGAVAAINSCRYMV